jgi:hypothetical protein
VGALPPGGGGILCRTFFGGGGGNLCNVTSLILVISDLTIGFLLPFPGFLYMGEAETVEASTALSTMLVASFLPKKTILVG